MRVRIRQFRPASHSARTPDHRWQRYEVCTLCSRWRRLLHRKEYPMHLMRLDPFRDLENMSARWNRAFANPLAFESPADGSVFGDWMPAMDIEESDREYLIKADLPAIR